MLSGVMQQKWTFRHSITNRRFGAAPRSSVRTLESSLSTYEVVPERVDRRVGRDTCSGSALLPNVAFAARKLRKPFVATWAVLYVCP